MLLFHSALEHHPTEFQIYGGCCLRTLCIAVPSSANSGTRLWSLLYDFLAKEKINGLYVHSCFNTNKFFPVKALTENKKLASLKGTNDCSQILQQEVFEGEDLQFQGFVVVNIKIILAL